MIVSVYTKSVQADNTCILGSYVIIDQELIEVENGSISYVMVKEVRV